MGASAWKKPSSVPPTIGQAAAPQRKIAIKTRRLENPDWATRLFFIDKGYGRGGGVGRGLGVGKHLPVQGVGVAVAVGLAVTVGVGVGVGPACAQYLPPVSK